MQDFRSYSEGAQDRGGKGKKEEGIPADVAAAAKAVAALAEGRGEGEILREYRGEGGFGYDPLFFSDDLQMTLAEAAPEAKNAISHRARAVEKLLKLLEAEDA